GSGAIDNRQSRDAKNTIGFLGWSCCGAPPRGFLPSASNRCINRPRGSRSATDINPFAGPRMSKPDDRITRREFVSDAGKAVIGAAITARAPMTVPRDGRGGPGFRAPGDVATFAVVGFGGMGSGNAQELAKTENLCAVCDVDLNFSATNVASKIRPNREGVINPAGTKLK